MQKKAPAASKGRPMIPACGMMVAEAIKASEILAKENISAAVIDAFTVKPIDKDAVLKNITTPIFDLLDDLFKKPVKTALEILPNVIYFIDSGNLEVVVLKYGDEERYTYKKPKVITIQEYKKKQEDAYSDMPKFVSSEMNLGTDIEIKPIVIQKPLETIAAKTEEGIPEESLT